jgi:hypothetical protein
MRMMRSTSGRNKSKPINPDAPLTTSARLGKSTLICNALRSAGPKSARTCDRLGMQVPASGSTSSPPRRDASQMRTRFSEESLWASSEITNPKSRHWFLKGCVTRYRNQLDALGVKPERIEAEILALEDAFFGAPPLKRRSA